MRKSIRKKELTQGEALLQKLWKNYIPQKIYNRKTMNTYHLSYDDNNAGYRNETGWYFTADNYDDFIKQYCQFLLLNQ